MGHSKGNTERDIHSNTGLPKEERKIANKEPNPTSKRTREKMTKPRESRRKKIIKIRAELNDTETKGTLKGSINPGAGSLKR